MISKVRAVTDCKINTAKGAVTLKAGDIMGVEDAIQSDLEYLVAVGSIELLGANSAPAPKVEAPKAAPRPVVKKEAPIVNPRKKRNR